MLAACLMDGLESNMWLYTLEISTLLRFKNHTKITVLVWKEALSGMVRTALKYSVNIALETLSISILTSHLLLVRYICLWQFFSGKPSASCVPPQEFFELWARFSSDFLVFWRKEQQLIAKQIYEETKRKVYKEKVEGITVKPATVTGLKLKLASSKKTSIQWAKYSKKNRACALNIHNLLMFL